MCRSQVISYRIIQCVSHIVQYWQLCSTGFLCSQPKLLMTYLWDLSNKTLHIGLSAASVMRLEMPWHNKSILLNRKTFVGFHTHIVLYLKLSTFICTNSFLGIRKKLEVASTEDNMRIKMVSHLEQRPTSMPIRGEMIVVDGEPRTRGRP